MTEPKSVDTEAADPLEVAVDQAIAVCDGDVRAALRAALVANSFLEEEVERLARAISVGYMRGKSPGRGAADKLEEWREISKGKLPQAE